MSNTVGSEARAAMQRKLDLTRYVITWRSAAASEEYSGPSGLTQAAQRVGISVASLRVYLANGKGSHAFQLTNPATGEPDLATLTRIYPPAKAKRPRGRPAKQLDIERLGIEAETARSMHNSKKRAK